MCVTRLGISTCKDESFGSCPRNWSRLLPSAEGKLFSVGGMGLLKVFERIWGKEGIHQQQSQHPLSHLASVMSSLVWSQAAATSDDLEDSVVKGFQGAAKPVSAPSAQASGVWAGWPAAVDLMGIGCHLTIPRQSEGSSSGGWNQDQPAQPLDKSVGINPEVKLGSLVSTSESGFALLVVTRVSQEARGCQPHP